MNKFFGLLLFFSFLAPLNIVQAMDDDDNDNDNDNDRLLAQALFNLDERERSTISSSSSSSAQVESDWLLAQALFDLDERERSTTTSSSSSSSSAQHKQEESDFLLARALSGLDMEPGASLRGQINKHPNIKQLREKFAPTAKFMDESTKSKQDASVHFMDVFYKANVDILIGAADELFPTSGTLTVEQVKEQLKKALTEHPYLFDGYTYQGTPVTQKDMEEHIDKTCQADMQPKLCSHAFNLALQLADSGDVHGFHRLFDAIAENYLTEGGCLEGRLNRQFVALSSMLMTCGL